MHAALGSSAFPLTRYVPHGWSWVYDVQRARGRRPFDVIVDAGANVGQTVRHLLRYAPEARIYAFEPVLATFDKLQAFARAHANVQCLQLGLGAAEHEALMALQENPEQNSLLTVPDGRPTGSSELVRIRTLDGFCAEEHIDHIDVLKMDVQGYEMRLLSGASRMLAERRIDFVYSEVGFRRGNTDMQHFAELNEAMERAGFLLMGFYEPFRWGPRREFLGFANALYSRPS